MNVKRVSGVKHVYASSHRFGAGDINTAMHAIARVEGRR
jgi:hypothetical protein